MSNMTLEEIYQKYADQPDVITNANALIAALMQDDDYREVRSQAFSADMGRQQVYSDAQIMYAAYINGSEPNFTQPRSSDGLSPVIAEDEINRDLLREPESGALPELSGAGFGFSDIGRVLTYSTNFPEPDDPNSFKPTGEHIEYFIDLYDDLIAYKEDPSSVENDFISGLSNEDRELLLETLTGVIEKINESVGATVLKNTGTPVVAGGLAGGLAGGAALAAGAAAVLGTGGLALIPIIAGAAGAIVVGGASATLVGSGITNAFKDSEGWQKDQLALVSQQLQVYFENLQKRDNDAYQLLFSNTHFREAAHQRTMHETIQSDPVRAPEVAKVELLRRTFEAGTQANEYFDFEFSSAHKQYLAKTSDSNAINYMRNVLGINLDLNNLDDAHAFYALRAEGALLNKGVNSPNADTNHLGIEWLQLWEENQELNKGDITAIFARIHQEQHQGFDGTIGQFVAEIWDKLFLTNEEGQSTAGGILEKILSGVLGFLMPSAKGEEATDIVEGIVDGILPDPEAASRGNQPSQSHANVPGVSAEAMAAVDSDMDVQQTAEAIASANLEEEEEAFIAAEIAARQANATPGARR